MFKYHTNIFYVFSGRHFMLPSGNLQIAAVRQSDAGLYRCIAVNPVTGQKRLAEHQVNLRVIGKYS